MSNTIQIKRSSTAAAVPTAGQLAVGELAVNLADRKLFTKDTTNTVVEIKPPSVESITGTTTASVPSAALGTGTADSSTFLRGDRTWQTLSLSPTTSQVLTATAGASVGAVGTYTHGFSAADQATGSTYAGSTILKKTTAAPSGVSAGLSGTWLVMGGDERAGGSGRLYLRIS